jgi:hypothetical protein
MFKLLEGQTDQETFDTVISKLAAQGKPSFDTGRGFCLYKHGDCKCAVGLLFSEDAPEDAYSFTGNVKDLYERYMIAKPRNLPLLFALQQAHDFPVLDYDCNHYNPISEESWRERAALRAVAVAEQYNLNPAEAYAWLDRQPLE